MINIAPYINKLEILKEYMDLKIDNIGKSFWIDIDSIPHMNPDYFIQLWTETGMIFYNGNPPPEPPRKLSSNFEEFYQRRINNFLS